MEIKDSGNRRKFTTGAVRDIQEGKGRCDLMPLDVIATVLNSTVLMDIYLYTQGKDTTHLQEALNTFFLEKENKNKYEAILDLSKHFEEGAKKYGEYNWQKGIPVNCYIDSAVRHYLKYKAGWTDEPHDRAFVWNIVCCIWEIEHHG